MSAIFGPPSSPQIGGEYCRIHHYKLTPRLPILAQLSGGRIVHTGAESFSRGPHAAASGAAAATGLPPPMPSPTSSSSTAAHPPPHPPPIGAAGYGWDDFEPESEWVCLGKGGGGTVYRVRHKASGREMALKELETERALEIDPAPYANAVQVVAQLFKEDRRHGRRRYLLMEYYRRAPSPPLTPPLDPLRVGF